MISRLLRLPALAAAACIVVLLPGCGDDAKQPSEKRDSAAAGLQRPLPPDTTLRENLPPGRFHIPTRHTPAPDFFITLPAGYTVKNRSRLPNDEYFIVRTDDPSLHDSTAVTPGFLRIYVGVRPQTGVRPETKFTERSVLLGRTMVTWKSWTDKLPDGAPYYIHEIASSDYFAAISPELARAPLNLHVYVGGRDKARVAELVRAAETLALTP